jgi:hypothetical protein
MMACVCDWVSPRMASEHFNEVLFTARKCLVSHEWTRVKAIAKGQEKGSWKKRSPAVSWFVCLDFKLYSLA